LGIVQACHMAQPTQDLIARKLGGKTLLEWVIRRATDCQRLDRVVVLLGDSAAERELARLVPPDVEVFAGSEPDPLSRFAAIAARHAAQAVVRICADNPFVDAVLIDRLVSTADAQPKSDYISYASSDGQPTILSSLGPYAEWCSAVAIDKANRLAKRPADRQEVTRYLFSHPDQFQVRLIALPQGLDRKDIQLRIDGREDWEHIQVLYDTLGPDEWDWNRLAGLLEQQQPSGRKWKQPVGSKTSAA
jgi:spore coat polysaccharide biosynthesis protein SpsF